MPRIDRARKADVRIIAATQRPGETLRPDILGRLDAHPFLLPPLRRRKEDLPALCRHFLMGQQAGKGRVGGLDRSAALALCLHRWPKNVRELEATLVEGALLAAERGATRIDFADLPPPLRRSLGRARAGDAPMATATTRHASRPRPAPPAESERLLRQHGGDVGSGDGRVVVWELESGRSRCSAGATDSCRAAFAADDRGLFVADETGGLYRYDLAGGPPDSKELDEQVALLLAALEKPTNEPRVGKIAEGNHDSFVSEVLAALPSGATVAKRTVLWTLRWPSTVARAHWTSRTATAELKAWPPPICPLPAGGLHIMST
jgi:hypothetical protein